MTFNQGNAELNAIGTTADCDEISTADELFNAEMRKRQNIINIPVQSHSLISGTRS